MLGEVILSMSFLCCYAEWSYAEYHGIFVYRTFCIIILIDIQLLNILKKLNFSLLVA